MFYSVHCTVEPRINEPLHNEVLGMTNDIFRPSNSVMYGITNQIAQSLGTSLNRGSTVLLSYDPYGPARNFLGKPYEKKSRMRAVRLVLAGPEKAVRPY